MKPTKNIEKLVRHNRLHLTAGSEMDKRILGDILEELKEKTKSKPADTKPNIWRIIMKSRITQLTTAAVIIIAVIIGINQLGGPVDITTIAFADITEAMNNVPWMHTSSRGFDHRVKGVVELWVGFETKINAVKDFNGEIRFWNVKEHKQYKYDPDTQTITIDYAYEDKMPLTMSSPVSLLESMHKMFKEQGAEIITKRGEYNGQNVQIQEISLSSVGQNAGSNILRFYIQSNSKLLLAAQVKGTDSNGNIVVDGETTFDYPQTGPADIYDLGAPRDARIIDKLPKKDYQAIWDIYRHSRTNATKQYIAVITRVSLGDFIDTVDVDYKLGRKHRLEGHAVFNQGEGIDKAWPEHKKQLGDSFESLLEWSRVHYDKKGHISISLYDGEYYCSISNDDKGNWGELRKHYKSNFSSVSNMPCSHLGWLAWPIIGKKGHIIKDDYARENNLICIERLQQGSIYRGRVNLPGRFLYYLDPQKDYICRRHVTEWRPNAQWQEDKGWLTDVEPEKIRDGSITNMDITEFIEAPNGYWYPRIIVEKQTGVRKDYQDVPLKVNTIKTVYLRTDPEFPEDIFDVTKLPDKRSPDKK
ncbi:MAG: hypothetical protein KAJ52_06925 [Sedimentisphaerales bacterium]|nr:hypothetical protein [Sedimentisphaerales bacterium]